MSRRRHIALLPLVVAVVMTACGEGTAPVTESGAADAMTTSSAAIEPTPDASVATTAVPSDTDTTGGQLVDDDFPSSSYLGDYTLTDEEFGTEVSVSVTDGVRRITANALPNHETGDFPNAGNPNTITAQQAEWTFPVEPVWTGVATWAQVPGVAINGVKFEPETAETVECATGQTYRIEALQQVYDLGFDVNNAHVQPNGEYHYHGISALMVEAFNGTDADLVHIGFAADGHLVMYSKSGALRSGYALVTARRTGSDCQPSLRNTTPIDLEGTDPDGTYVSDWEWSADNGDLDECNGTTTDGAYVYIVTDEYPFIGRCLKGESTATAPAGPGGGGQRP